MPAKDVKDGGMKVKIEVAIYVIKAQPQRPKFAKLGVNLVFQMFAQFAVEKVPKTRPHRAGIKFEALIDQPDNLAGFQGRTTADHDHVQANPKPRISRRNFGRRLRPMFINHETGAGQNPFPMGPLNRPVDPGRTPKVVGIDDQPDPVARTRTGRFRRDFSGRTRGTGFA
jgi:hypothetical protein